MSTPRWLEKARDARRQLADTKDGERERRLNEIAGNNEVNSVRRLLLALGVFDRWTAAGKVEATRLLTAPQTIIEVLARWDEFDPEGAWKAFEQWESGGFTVQTMNAALRHKREAGGIMAGRSLESGFRKAIAPALPGILRDLIPAGFSLGDLHPGQRSHGMPPVDFDCLATKDDEHGLQMLWVATLIVGPYRSANLYSRKMSEWMQKALSIAWLYQTVVLLVPDKEQAREYQHWMRNFHRHVRSDKEEQHPHIHIVEVPRGKEPGDDQDETGENP